MIKFFRHIRKSLIHKNQMGNPTSAEASASKTTSAKTTAGKYLKYAIGEIVLVVIGILIALQVNDWNEQRKERVAERKILNEILIDLESAQKDLIKDIEINEDNLSAAEELKLLLLNKQQKGDTIIRYMNQAYEATQFYPRTTGYQSLKSKGLDLISSESLRKAIINLFDLTFQIAIREGREYEKMENSESDLDTYLRKHLTIDPSQSLLLSYNDGRYQHTTSAVKIRDFDALYSDSQFLTMLNKSIIGRVAKIALYIETKEKSEMVSKAIKETLGRQP